MKQKLLFFILLLCNFSSIAAEDPTNLPQLPEGSKIFDSTSTKKEKLTNIDNLKLPKLDDLESEQEDKSSPTLPDPIENKKNIDKQKTSQAEPVQNINLPDPSLSKEVPNLIKPNSDQHPSIKDETNDLKLPSGFDDTIKDETPSLLTKNIENITDSPKIEEKNTTDQKNDVEQQNVKTDSTSSINKSSDTTKPEETKEIKKPEPNNESLPIPSYAMPGEETKTTEPDVAKFTKTFTNTKENKIELPKITENDYVDSKIKTESEIDPIQLQFINNETQLLILPDDDIVLGELTEAATLYYIDMDEYIKIFWDNYDKLKREPKRQEIERFIKKYDENFNQEIFN